MAPKPLRFERLPSGMFLTGGAYTIDHSLRANGAWVLIIHGHRPAGGVAEVHEFPTAAEAKAAARRHHGEVEEDPEFALLRRELAES